MTDEEVDKKIEDWHFNNAGPGLELWEYLGWTYAQYAHWAVSGEKPNA